MTKTDLATVVTAVALAATGAAFGAYLAVSEIEEQIHKYFGGQPIDRDTQKFTIDDIVENGAKLAVVRDEIRDGAPWRL